MSNTQGMKHQCAGTSVLRTVFLHRAHTCKYQASNVHISCALIDHNLLGSTVLLNTRSQGPVGAQLSEWPTKRRHESQVHTQHLRSQSKAARLDSRCKLRFSAAQHNDGLGAGRPRQQMHRMERLSQPNPDPSSLPQGHCQRIHRSHHPRGTAP